MLTDQGCRARRDRLWKEMQEDLEWIVVTQPQQLMYFANFSASPFVFNSQGAAAALILGRDGSATLIADNVQDAFSKAAFADEKIAPLWYRCVESAPHRGALLVAAVVERLQKCAGSSFGYEATSAPAALIEGLCAARPGTQFTDIDPIVRRLRRAKDPDEVALIRRSLHAATAALVAAMAEIKPGMTGADTPTGLSSALPVRRLVARCWSTATS